MPVRILFVCYENICRSPMAEGVFRHLSDMHGVAGHFEVKSAGTVCYQSGSYPDPRAIRAAARYGFDISENRAQCIHDLDLSVFDRVFVMDFENYHDVLETLDGAEGVRVHMMSDYTDAVPGAEIEDPYYGPEEGFDSTLSMLAHCADGILRHMREMHGIVPEDAGAVISSETVQAAGNDSGR